MAEVLQDKSITITLEDLVKGVGNHTCHPLATLKTKQGNALREFSAQHASVALIDWTHMPVPRDTINAAEEIMQSSQRNFLTTWLADHLSGRQVVRITEEDIRNNPEVNFNSDIGLLESYRDSLIDTNTMFPKEVQHDLERIKAIVAANRIVHAVVKREAEGVTRFLMMGTVIGGLQFLLQERFGLNPAVYALASTVDNGFAMVGEADKLRRQGFSLKETWRAMYIPAGVLAVSIGVAGLVHNRFEAGQDTLAGSLYGGESAICITPSIFGAISSMRPDYCELVIEGKIDDPILENLLTRDNPNLWDKVRTFLIGSQRALKHDLIYPHHIGLYAGASLGIILSTILASIPVSQDRVLMQHPFIVAPLGIVDSAGGAIAGLSIDWIYNQKLRRDLNGLAKN